MNQITFEQCKPGQLYKVDFTVDYELAELAYVVSKGDRFKTIQMYYLRLGVLEEWNINVLKNYAVLVSDVAEI